MKQLLFLVLGVLSFSAGAQELDTIFANENHNTALFFPSKVRQGIVGSQNFVFSYNEEKPQYFGLLKAVPGTSSNLLVITEDGQIYSYVLSYKAQLHIFNYFIGTGESIGHEKTMEKICTPALAGDTVSKKLPNEYLRTNQGMFKKRSVYYLKNSKGEIKSRKKGGLRITVKDMVYFKDEVYLVLALENRSEITFEPDFLNVYVSRGNSRRNASFQRLRKEPIYIHQFPKTIYHRQEKKFVLVFPKFTLGENGKLELEVREKKGSRYLRMKFKQ